MGNIFGQVLKIIIGGIMIKYINTHKFVRKATYENIEKAEGGNGTYLLKYYDDYTPMPILWVHSDYKIHSNIIDERVSAFDTDISKLILVHTKEIINIHEGERTVAPYKIPQIMLEYKQELSMSILSDIQLEEK